VRNVFDLRPDGRAARPEKPSALRLVTLGTVEPRKNFMAAAKILTALREWGFDGATLDIVGRQGWGDDWKMLEKCPGVVLHGYQSNAHVSQILEDADMFICTSHEEGLGLPLLEAQYAGLPIVAPDAAIFREVLGHSGIFIDPAHPASAADKICDAISRREWRVSHATLGAHNLTRWNALASGDRDAVISLVAQIARQRPAVASKSERLNQKDHSITL
jgi:glycosyltransferase involved in cell wall biosynthesis